MLTSRKNLPKSRALLTITVTADQYRHAFEHELAEVAKDVTIEGFRKGMAPQQQVLAKVGRQRVEASALDHAISHAYYDALQEAKLIPVEGPKVEVTEFTAPAEDAKDDTKVATFTAEVDILPEISIKGYQKIKIKAPKPTPVEDKDVEEVINYLRKQQSSLKEVSKESKIEKGSWADIAFTGSVGGVEREDMKSEHHPVMVGEGTLIPGFEDQLIGMKAGEEKSFDITFPKDYNQGGLAGKKAHFTVKVNEVKEVILPDLDNDFAMPFGKKNVDELKLSIRENLEDERAEEQKRKLEDLVIEQLLKITKFDLPESLVVQEEERVLNESKERVSKVGLQWSQYLEQIGKSEEDLKKELREQSEKNVRIGLALGKVVQEEGITDKEQAMRQAVDKLIEYATR